MAERVIPLVDQRHADLVAQVPLHPSPATGLLVDTRGRPLRDLRISVTDRCNFRCNYCMPKEVFDKDYPYLPHGALLSFEEITRTAKLFVAHGVRKIRLTGGEPLLRKNIEVLIEQLAALRTPDGQPLDLPAREFEVLWELMSPAGRVVSKRTLSQKLSEFDEALGDNALEAFISRLRKKLQGVGVRIRTLRGLGYVLEADRDDRT